MQLATVKDKRMRKAESGENNVLNFVAGIKNTSKKSSKIKINEKNNDNL